MKLSKEQLEQEKEYKIPYHHLLKKGELRGIEYFSYLDIIIRLLKEYNPEKILDVGCGDGRVAKELNKHFKNIVGVDYSRRAISFAKRFSPNVPFGVIDFTKEINKYKSKFGAVVCVEVLEHIQPQKLGMFVDNISKTLKKEGVVIVTTPTTNLKLQQKHHQHFNEKKLDYLFSKSFIKKKVIYHSNKFTNLIFFIFRGVFTNRFYDIKIKPINLTISKFYRLFVEKANESNGQRIIYVCEKK